MSEEFQPIRIENKRFEKNIKLFKVLAIIATILAVYRILSTPDIFTGTGKLMDFGTTLIPIILFFEYRRKSKNWGGQFIEWTNEHLNFKTRHSERTSIANTSITGIEIKLDEILVSTSEQ